MNVSIDKHSFEAVLCHKFSLPRMAFDIRARKLYYWIAHDGPQRVIEIDIKIDQTSMRYFVRWCTAEKVNLSETSKLYKNH